MIELHFIEPKEQIPEDWESIPNLKSYAEKYRDFLIQEEKSRMEFEKKNPSELYIPKTFPIIDDIYIEKRLSRFRSVSLKYRCLECLIGEKMYMEWKVSIPEVQKAITETKVAGIDWYKQFESNPDGRIDYLDNLKDRNRYGSEFEKIESAIKGGKHENR